MKNAVKRWHEHPAQRLLGLPRMTKRLLAMGVDAVLCMLTAWLSICLRFDAWITPSNYQWLAIVAAPVLAVPLFAIFGLYRSVFRFAGHESILALLRAVGVYTVCYAGLFSTIGFPLIPRTIGLLQPALLLLAVGSSRLLAREMLGERATIAHDAAHPQANPVLIYGAGQTGRQLAQALTASPMQVIGFLDDNPSLHGGLILGRKVYPPSQLSTLVHSHHVRDVLLALPSVTRSRRTDIVKLLKHSRVAVRTLPRLADLARPNFNVQDLHQISLEDLLGRDPVVPNPQLMARNIEGKSVMVTGAGGSIGSELCRQILAQRPACLILLELSEFALYTILETLTQQLKHQPNHAAIAPTRIVPLLADVRHAEHIRALLMQHRPHTVFHAAAYKHVPLVEANPVAAIQNNIVGTLNIAQAAIDAGVADVVLISTDKAVRPTSIMGATKRVAEMVLQAQAQRCQQAQWPTRLSMVRFGNVLGSSGSVVPKFQQQIQDAGPLSVTHPDITRYFMTIPEAAQLVIQAAAMSTDTTEAGPVYLLDMGEPVKIHDLARLMIQLSGLTERCPSNPQGDIAIEFTGLRPGEKLYEELLISSTAQPTSNPKILRAQEQSLPWSQLEPLLRQLQALHADTPLAQAQQALQHCVTDYQPSSVTG